MNSFSLHRVAGVNCAKVKCVVICCASLIENKIFRVYFVYCSFLCFGCKKIIKKKNKNNYVWKWKKSIKIDVQRRIFIGSLLGYVLYILCKKSGKVEK